MFAFLMCLLVQASFGQRISRSYNNRSMSEVLKDLDKATRRYKISFIYNELEDFTVTTSFRNLDLQEALGRVFGFYPMKATIEDSLIFVECTQKEPTKLMGRVIDERHRPVEFANVALLNPRDSSFLTGGVTNASGNFVIPCGMKKVLAKVSCVGYHTLYNIYNKEKIFVNSFHHQAVSEPGNHLRTIAKSSDHIIEAVESSEYKQILGVQWHPEWLEEEGLKIFQWLVNQANNFYAAKQLHKRILTLDTHCDTPMFFPQGIKFDHRDSRILVDLHKMTDGHQDATTMVAYLPQPQIGESFSSKVAFDVKGPAQYADLIFDKIEEIVSKNSQYLSIARTPADLYSDKRKGRKSIMLGIENGLALEHDISNVKHFAQRGIVYITLCHNGDNDICDSARGCNTHNGVSSFGEKVIHEMNRLGIMVDLSHGGEKSFYDALDISQAPIVCSHSSSRALCDVPRNLTDDQMRALAAKGGVAHTTLYHGFLRKEGEADIMDAIAHLEHAIDVMGIDHVGLGTDFDGDGGIRGLADSSELINFTLQLLRRKYSEQDIVKIWGGNWLRVMTQVQNFGK